MFSLLLKELVIDFYLHVNWQRTCKNNRRERIWVSCKVSHVNLSEKWISSHIYISFFVVFCSLFMEFWSKSCKISGGKSFKPTCFIIAFNSRLHDVTSIERYVGQPTVSISLSRNLTWTSVVLRCMNRVGKKKGSSKGALSVGSKVVRSRLLPRLESIKGNINDYIWNKHVNFYL